jgi:hypothetical protein
MECGQRDLVPRPLPGLEHIERLALGAGGFVVAGGFCLEVYDLLGKCGSAPT